MGAGGALSATPLGLSGLCRAIRPVERRKTLFAKIAARSMFGSEKMIRSGQFTAGRLPSGPDD
jgi:hypothetical protein